MGSQTSIKALFQGMTENIMPEIVVGIVVSEEPVTITLKNEISINLSAQSLIIPSSKAEFIKKGAELYMLSTNSSKMYYILDRV